MKVLPWHPSTFHFWGYAPCFYFWQCFSFSKKSISKASNLFIFSVDSSHTSVPYDQITLPQPHTWPYNSLKKN